MESNERLCLVCRDDEKLRWYNLPSGGQVRICLTCSKDSFRLAEAEKRAALAVVL